MCIRDRFSESLNSHSHGDLFCRAAVALHEGDLPKTLEIVQAARVHVDQSLMALGTGTNESNDPEAQYLRVYKTVVRLQRLTELEEAVRGHRDHNYRRLMKLTWTERLRGMTPSAEVWQRSRAVHCLVLSARENLDMELMFVGLCRQTGREAMAQRTLLRVCAKLDKGSGKVTQPHLHPDPRVRFQWAKTMWRLGERTVAHGILSELTSSDVVKKGDAVFYTRCLQKRGEYLRQSPDPDHRNSNTALSMFEISTETSPDNYRGWHDLAILHYQIIADTGEIAIVRGANSPTSANSPRRSPRKLRRSSLLDMHVVPAVTAFVRAIQLDGARALQDKLRLFRLWCAYGQQPGVQEVVQEFITRAPADVWLPLAAQILACIDVSDRTIRSQIRDLVIRMAKEHPNALLLPLMVLVNQTDEGSQQQRDSVNYILSSLEEDSPERAQLVREARLLTFELERSAVLWEEQCKVSLDEAANQWYVLKDQAAALTTLNAMHATIQGAQQDTVLTPAEVGFLQRLSAKLSAAKMLQRRYEASRMKESVHMQQAWRLYKQIFDGIAKRLDRTNELSMASASPLLRNHGEMKLAMPGTYKPGQPYDCIAGFDDKIVVLGSKQRPRKINILSSAGDAKPFLLKGNEDLRQDERVMQLLQLVSSLLGQHRQQLQMSLHVGLSIPRYAIVPVSVNCGLAQWVPNTDTLQALISKYREDRGIPPRIEMQRVHHFCGGPKAYDQLPLPNKMEAFEEGLSTTSGTDLYKIMWLRAPSAQEWLRRRVHFTKTLASNSMVGYILGLGDRHPQNIMIERTTGNVIHIDYGECFEMTQHRENFPEKVPFRLTRQLAVSYTHLTLPTKRIV
eukprot:TRINITY_DN18953_c0_g2_i2.p1 TRINITY_DN18953_c0_g2~~TRINITY_DN18953_c0_g2_i2.p1  ORF type:complete len:849 (-),score=171.05 TRINITY_DN18953_c0_g2_i2:95-2641(-)